ncbi:hypothetical protein [Borrelia sp. RT1S]|uniref:hypothetical protein n=1 Tax=Borrelia sp. RT1S TaxID=2898580 RepID=UPI001E575864|nr:hypothetical protein [Borrelia sp. RT1S]UGQ17868.1 hypothetical protein LSO05_05400 [Borrelia sp. RT1S]
MSSNNFSINFNNPLYRERLIADKYFDNPYLDMLNSLFIKTPVTEKGGTLTLYSMDNKQEDAKLASFNTDPKQLKDGISKSTFMLNGYSLERAFGDIEYKSEEVIKRAEKLVMRNLAKVVYRSYLLEGMNDLHTKSTPVEVKTTDDFLSKLKEVRGKLHLRPNRIVMTAKTANDLINSDSGIQKRIELYKVPEFDEASLLKVSLGIQPFIFELPEDHIYDGYIYLLHYSKSDDVYTKSVGLRNFVYNGGNTIGTEKAIFYDGQFARTYYLARGGMNGNHYAQFGLIGQLKVENPDLFAVLKLSGAKALPKAYAAS